MEAWLLTWLPLVRSRGQAVRPRRFRRRRASSASCWRRRWAGRTLTLRCARQPPAGAIVADSRVDLCPISVHCSPFSAHTHVCDTAAPRRRGRAGGEAEGLDGGASAGQAEGAETGWWRPAAAAAEAGRAAAGGVTAGARTRASGGRRGCGRAVEEDQSAEEGGAAGAGALRVDRGRRPALDPVAKGDGEAARSSDSCCPPLPTTADSLGMTLPGPLTTDCPSSFLGLGWDLAGVHRDHSGC